ncbi:xylose isomerase-like protein [Auriculariales sp. MPI-PUGE-AT-0066]|nr:xylose isomerase-like protein [Auriculariales sp. MPI-PUGE-AT-0066]
MSNCSRSLSDDEGPARKKLKADAPLVPSRMGSTILMETQETQDPSQDVAEDMEVDNTVSQKSGRGRPRKFASAADAEKKTSARPARGRKSAASIIEHEADDAETVTPKQRVGRKKKAEEEVILPPRVESDWKIGAHVSAAGGPQNAVLNAAKIGAGAFALFLKSQRKWVSPAYKPQDITAFHAAMKEHNYAPEHVLPHGSYLLNLGNPDEAKRNQSYTCFLDDLRRAEQLGLLLYNFHPGSTVGACTREQSIANIAASLNRAHKETSRVVTVLENMAGQGNVIGSQFEDLRDIIALVEDKTRVGVCLDTCHTFAAGYDIRTRKHSIGVQYLRGMHLNDSKFDLAGKKDRHENMGIGKIGLRAFSFIANDTRMRNIPLILETPCEDDTGPNGVWAVEVAALYEMAADTQKANVTRVDVATVTAAFDKSGNQRAGGATSPQVSSAVVTAVAVATVANLELSDSAVADITERVRVAAVKSNAKKAALKAKKTASKTTKRKKKADDDESEDDNDDADD